MQAGSNLIGQYNLNQRDGPQERNRGSLFFHPFIWFSLHSFLNLDLGCKAPARQGHAGSVISCLYVISPKEFCPQALSESRFAACGQDAHMTAGETPALHPLMRVAVTSGFGANMEGAADFGNQGFVIGNKG